MITGPDRARIHSGGKKTLDPARIRTWNLLIRSQTRYPLRHRTGRLGWIRGRPLSVSDPVGRLSLGVTYESGWDGLRVARKLFEDRRSGDLGFILCYETASKMP
ncbi:hypothetical protein Zmor_009329 [Zophobas morio]|uniref:Uncharacterized protein n=1 Tax=Zophobas morio TaxID=2755281 RepID=A0AA38MIK5_9CUCU|nr:hypothetical protein Zmor_009329 [Zophobas morio]